MLKEYLLPVIALIEYMIYLVFNEFHRSWC